MNMHCMCKKLCKNDMQILDFTTMHSIVNSYLKENSIAFEICGQILSITNFKLMHF